MRTKPCYYYFSIDKIFLVTNLFYQSSASLPDLQTRWQSIRTWMKYFASFECTFVCSFLNGFEWLNWRWKDLKVQFQHLFHTETFLKYFPRMLNKKSKRKWVRSQIMAIGKDKRKEIFPLLSFLFLFFSLSFL